MSFEKHVFAGKGTFEVSLPFDFKNTDDVLVFFVISTGGVFDGTLGQLLATGEVVSLTERTYRFLGTEGVELHGVIGCQSPVLSEARSLLRAIEELRAEMKSVLRFPDKWLRKIHSYPAKVRAGKTIVFDADGQPRVDDLPVVEVLNEWVEKAQAAAQRAETAKGETAHLALSAEASSRSAEKLLQKMQQLADDVFSEADKMVKSAQAEILRIVSNAENATAELQRKALAQIKAEVASAREQSVALKEEFSSVFSSSVKALHESLIRGEKSIAEKIAEAQQNFESLKEHSTALKREFSLELSAKFEELRALIALEGQKIIDEIKSYRYEVLTREKYEQRKAEGTLESDVIYFVRGTVDVGKLVLEWLEKGVGQIPENQEAFQQLITEQLSNEIRDVRADMTEGFSERPTQTEIEDALREFKESTSEDVGAQLQTVANAINAETQRAQEAEAGLVPYLPANNSDDMSGIFGKTVFAIGDGDRGGFRVAGSQSSRANWTRYLLAMLWNKIRAYGSTDGQYEEFVFTVAGGANDEQNKVIRRKELSEFKTEAFTNPVLREAYVGVPAKVLCPEITGDADVRGFFGMLGELLRVSGECNISPTAITAYKRGSGGTTLADMQRFLRVLRYDAETGEWRVAFESTNTIRQSDYGSGEAMTWQMVNKDGRGAIPSSEQVAIVQTGAATNIATATDAWGVKVSSHVSGAILPGQDLVAANRQSYAPALDIAYDAVDLLADKFVSTSDYDALVARVAALEATRSEG